jgi:raffinose/stachyose/melibiose transport system permease protein
MTFAYSFADVKETNFGFEYKFVGFSHYTDAFLGNLDFTESLLSFVSMELAYVPIILIISFIIAYFLTKDIKGKTIFRTIFFLPVIIISGSLIARIFPEPMVTEAGTVIEETNALESSFVYLIIRSYSKGAAEVIAYIYEQFVIILWFTGIPIILFINGLQKINPNLYEASQIDGATSWQTLTRVKLPMVMPSITICVFLTLTNSFKLFDQNLALTAGEPRHATEMLALNIYNTFYARAGAQWKGLGQAKAVVFCILVIVISLIQFKATHSKEVQQ